MADIFSVLIKIVNSGFKKHIHAKKKINKKKSKPKYIYIAENIKIPKLNSRSENPLERNGRAS